MTTTVAGVTSLAFDTAPAGATHDSPSLTVSAGQALVVLGAASSQDLTLNSAVWDPSSNNESMNIRVDFYGNFGNIFIAELAAPSAGTGVVRLTFNATPDDNVFFKVVRLSADGTLSFGAVSTAAQADNTTVTSDGTGICLDIQWSTFTTGSTYDSGDQTILGGGVVSGDTFYSGGVSSKAAGASSTNMNWTSTNTPHHACIHMAESGGLSATVNQASETDSAQALSSQKAKDLGQPSETDAAQALSSLKVSALTQPSETDLAQPITVIQDTMIAVGQVSETDLAQPVAAPLISLVGQAAETDLAQALTSAKAKEIAQVVEAIEAAGIPALKTKEIGQVAETDLSQSVTVDAGQTTVAVGQVSETDAAQTLGGTLKEKEVGQASETDTPQTISASRVYDLGQVSEIDSAQVIDIATARLVRQVTETDVSLPVTVDGGTAPGTAQSHGGGGFHRRPREDAWRAIDARRGRHAGRLTREEMLEVQRRLEDEEILAIIEVVLKHIA